jgi:hypothetical protein
LAVAAVAASILFAKGRHAPSPEELNRPNVLEDQTALEALRAAGF